MSEATTFALNGDNDVRVWAAELDDGRRVPLKALFRRATDLSDFTSQRAQSVISRLGFRVINVAQESRGTRPSSSPNLAAPSEHEPAPVRAPAGSFERTEILVHAIDF